uniref:Na+/H+ antiporter NhaC n=1 Tax=Roseihalotalea indica TaxID=2867963 RepID=A0AA49GH58_9BACT|nr:Na+/H+ antiporter NhaC [Tunicatimonas sp. TK19036]
MPSSQPRKPLPFIFIILPLLFLTVLIAYGLVLRPLYYDLPPFPLEIVFLLAAVFTIGELLLLGFAWEDIQEAFIAKLAQGFPVLLILFAIGIIIGTWMVSGTIPMLIYYGIKLINPSYMYVLAFFTPIIFSMLTGTSWGSVGTIGAVVIGVAHAVDANLGITAGAIIGGAYFGDKLSPLSDTTNMAALATEIPLFAHIRSMMYTTLPSALIAGVIYFVLGYLYPPAKTDVTDPQITETLAVIQSMFNFNILLLIPPVIVLYGSLKRMATLPTLLTSALVACLLAAVFQPYSGNDILQASYTGFDVAMADGLTSVPENIPALFNRGGLYALNEPIIFTIMVLIFIGAMDMVEVMPTIVDKVFSFTRTRPAVIISSLFATAFSNAITSNQNATSFIIGDAFKSRYDKFGIPRNVLSRSIEDYGTMIESIVPWTASTIFMVATLGVPFADYWHWQLLSLINLIVAPVLAITGIGCFYKERKTEERKMVNGER